MKKFAQWLAYLIGTPCFYLSHYLLELADRLTGGQYKGFMGRRHQFCRYGENGWQKPAAIYRNPFVTADDPLKLTNLKQVGGSAPSYNNYNDFQRGGFLFTHLVESFVRNFGEIQYLVTAVKHGNPCGCAVHGDREEAVIRTLKGDPLAVNGAVMDLNFLVDGKIAELILHYNNPEGRRIIDGVMAPGFTAEAIKAFERKKGKCPLIVCPALATLGRDCLDRALHFRYLRGQDFLLQPNFTFIFQMSMPYVAKYGQATIQQEKDMVFLKAIIDCCTSNTIAIGGDFTLFAAAVAQQSRIAAADLGIANSTRSLHDLHGSVSASDSFFLVTDAPGALIKAGIAAILSTSRVTSMSKDPPIIKFCQDAGIPLYLTPDDQTRGFFHG
ncbi:MAG: hypothetical protein PHE24_04825 [Patescibacteria group bacterium]|nr:hypothetical protein [Patescibacteria group bacterium]